MTTTIDSGADPIDALALLRGFVSLRRLAGMYPSGHPVIAQKLDELICDRPGAPAAESPC